MSEGVLESRSVVLVLADAAGYLGNRLLPVALSRDSQMMTSIETIRLVRLAGFCKNPDPLRRNSKRPDASFRQRILLLESPYLMSRLANLRRSAIGRILSCHSQLLLWSVVLATSIGCRTTAPAIVGLPKGLAIENEHLLVRTDLKLPKDHAVLQDLDRLRDEIADELNLPVQKQPVTVYLFSDELRYAQYLQTRYPLLPPRRAYFVGTSKELAVYTFWGERIQEDLRHEYTHGVLHATLIDVPLWLDEGLAEYFEVTSQPRGLNRDYAMRLATNLAQGWKPDLDRLESLEKVEDMQKGDYLEAWAWVHFMLHHSEETRAVLVEYLHELRTTGTPGMLSARLRQEIPQAERRFASHAASLTTGIQQAGGSLEAPRTVRH